MVAVLVGFHGGTTVAVRSSDRPVFHDGSMEVGSSYRRVGNNYNYACGDNNSGTMGSIVSVRGR